MIDDDQLMELSRRIVKSLNICCSDIATVWISNISGGPSSELRISCSRHKKIWVLR